MFDWNWLWVAGELGVSCGFYYWWKSNEKYLAILQVAPNIDIDDLRHYGSSKSVIDFAAVHGFVRTNDSKPSSVLKSQFLPHCFGVIQRIILREKKIEKVGSSWNEKTKLISDIKRSVPFRLTSQSGNYIQIDKPLAFSSIIEQLETVHVKLEPNTSSSLNKIVDVVLGDLSTGLETHEQMLCLENPLTGVGRLEKGSNGIWRLVPHPKWGGILTRSTRAELVSSYEDNSSVIKFFSICFAIAAAGTAAYLLYKHYSKQQHELGRIHLTRTTATTSRDQIRCISCGENDVAYNLEPCAHFGFCQSCADTFKSKPQSEQLCPNCHASIERYQRTYLS